MNSAGDTPAERNQRPRRRVIVEAFIGIFLLLLFISAAWYLSSPQFNKLVRDKLVADIEHITGGRVDLGSFQWNLSQLRFEARDLTIHGLEAPGTVPYVHADRVIIRLKILSFLGRDIAVRHVVVERPVIHLSIYSDGTTNQPPLTNSAGINQNVVERLFDLSVGRFDVQNGELLVNDNRIPLDFTAADVTAGMSYAFSVQRYVGSLHVGKLDAKPFNWRPFASTVDLEFNLVRTAAEIKSLKIASGHSQIVGSGHITDFNHLKLDTTFTASVNVGEFASIARLSQLRHGFLTIKGRGSYSDGRHSSFGNLTVAELDVDTPSASVRNAKVLGDYVLTEDRLLLSHLVGSALGGGVSGELEVVNWNSSSAGNRKGLRMSAAEQQGVARLRVERVSVGALAGAVSLPTFPLSRLKLSGNASGTVNASWRGAPQLAEARLALTVSPPTQPRPEELPLTGNLLGIYHGASRIFDVTEFVFATRASHLDATGTLGGSAANLKVTVSTTDIRELQPVIAALSGPAAFPLKIRGQASFEGTLAGKLAQPTLFGHLKIIDFDTLLAWRKNPLSKSGTAAVSQLHWDVVDTDVQLSPTAAAFHHGVLRRGTSELNFEVTTALTNFQLTDHTPFRAELKLRQGDIAGLEALAGHKYPLGGNVNLVLHLSGTRLYPNGDGNLLITNATAYGQPVDRLSTHLHFGNGEVQLSDINASQSRAIVSGDATSNLATGAFRFNLQGKGFDLASLKVRRSASLTVAGELSFTAAGSGTIDEPVINASLDVRNLVLGGEPEGNFHADAVTHGANLRLTTRSDFLHAQLAIEGGVYLRGEIPANLKLKFDRLDVDPLLHSFLKGRITGHSSTAGSLTLTGPLKRPRDLSIQGDLDQLLVDIENVRIQNDGAIRFAMTERTLTLERFHLVGEDTDISATGSAELAGSGRLNMKAVGRVNLKSIQTINPDYLSAGLMTIDLTVGGTPASPDLQGQVKVTNGALAYIDMPSGLSDINGTLAFNQDRLVVQSLTARTGGGQLNLGGFITYTRGLNFDLTAKGKDIRLRYPPGMSSTADLDLHLTGSLTSSLLSGDILVTRFGMNRDFDFALYLARAKQPPQLANPDSPLSNLKFDLHITTTPELQVQTSLAKISGDADLHLRGTGTHPVVLGRANIAQGDVDFNGTKYHLERGEVLFTNPVRIEPVLDLEATARVRDYDITLGFHGPIDKLSTTYSSDPPLPTADIIALLAVGRTREETALQQQPQTGAMQSASNAILGEALNATTSNRLEKLFGVSRIKIDPQAGGAENNPSGTRVTIEQQVSNNVTLTYITNVSQTSQQIIQAEYYITKNISIIAVRDQNGVVGMDVRLRQRKK